jgi:hypothetical protein
MHRRVRVILILGMVAIIGQVAIRPLEVLGHSYSVEEGVTSHQLVVYRPIGATLPEMLFTKRGLVVVDESRLAISRLGLQVGVTFALAILIALASAPGPSGASNQARGSGADDASTPVS